MNSLPSADSSNFASGAGRACVQEVILKLKSVDVRRLRDVPVLLSHNSTTKPIQPHTDVCSCSNLSIERTFEAQPQPKRK
ncbi:hypothetical protein TrLO_g3095 [Triparma laevis f. longispina]|uniref:Uncharacterized protein n=1 Tax=Triparma laevis f. longispina TaxID=1714387 RepID=A0A9W7F7J9_9STRA|nr:hypothetical protein TrLO_g3095 [Triparma laevis f. longispina]